MKLLIIFLAVVAIALTEFTDEEEKKWRDFKLEHGKMFLSPGKEKARKRTFLKNAKDVDEHNKKFSKGEVTYKKKIYEYSDLTEEEFISRFTGIDPEDFEGNSEGQHVTLRQTPPASVDLRGQPGVGPVRNQRSCGSCYVFSAMATVEYAYWKKTGIVVDVSEQEAVDCARKPGADGCAGGGAANVMRYIAMNGITSEDQYPYTAKWGECQNTTQTKVATLQPLKDPFLWFGDNDEISIKNALNEYGVLSVCMYVGGTNSYGSGIYVNSNYADPKCNHAVGLVGYGTEGDIPYWIIRNSWGPKWGEQGYIRLDARRDPVTNNTLGGLFLKHCKYALA